MDQVPTTFIPKQSLIVHPETRRSGGILMFIGLVALFASMLLAGGAYFYKTILTTNVVTLSDSLQKSQAAFEPATLQSLERLDSRLSSATELLGKHVTLLPLFYFFNTQTIQTLRYKNFSYTFNNSTNKVDVHASGEAKDYQSIAYQSDVYAGTGVLQNFIFSDLNLDSTGRVIFNFSGTVDPTLISYNEALRAAQATQQ